MKVNILASDGEHEIREATPDEIRAAYAALEPDESLKYTWRDVKAGDRVTFDDGTCHIRTQDASCSLTLVVKLTLVERGGYGAWRTVKPGETI